VFNPPPCQGDLFEKCLFFPFIKILKCVDMQEIGTICLCTELIVHILQTHSQICGHWILSNCRRSWWNSGSGLNELLFWDSHNCILLNCILNRLWNFQSVCCTYSFEPWFDSSRLSALLVIYCLWRIEQYVKKEEICNTVYKLPFCKLTFSPFLF
jgi:hypothetical protein